VSDDREHEGREEYTKRDGGRASKRVTETIMHVTPLKSDKSRKDNKRSGEDIANRDAVDEGLLRDPVTKQHCLCMNEWNCGICTAKREAACDEAKNKEVREIWGPCDAEGKG